MHCILSLLFSILLQFILTQKYTLIIYLLLIEMKLKFLQKCRTKKTLDTLKVIYMDFHQILITANTHVRTLHCLSDYSK